MADARFEIITTSHGARALRDRESGEVFCSCRSLRDATSRSHASRSMTQRDDSAGQGFGETSALYIAPSRTMHTMHKSQVNGIF